MTKNKLISKSVFILVVLLVAGVSAANIRLLKEQKNGPWCDQWCAQFTSDGMKCLKCSVRCYMDKWGKCQPVSDYCATWDECTGQCLTCYPGYGAPVKGCCPSIPVSKPKEQPKHPKYPKDEDCDYCKVYGYIDSKSKIYTKWYDGCKKVCIECEYGYYLNKDYKCIELPPYCKAADKYGECTECVKGYHLDCGKCVIDVIDTVIDHCIQYGYIDSYKKWYSKWQSGCKKVCKVCDCDYYLTCDYTCAPLPKCCKSADMYGKCIECVKGYHLEKGVCVVDEEDHCVEYGWIDAAKKWHLKQFKGCKKQCKCCEKGYYLNCDYICVKLPEKCQEADIYGKCTKCCQGYIWKGDKCVEQDHCAVYGWIDVSKKIHHKQTKGCKKICTCCDKGYYLDCDYKCVALPPYCQAANIYGKCTECCKGYKLIDGECKVDDHCQQYSWIGTDKKIYKSWVKGCEKVCTCCEKGYYLDCDYKCQELPPYCEAANIYGKCTECCKGYKLIDGECKVDDHCQEYVWISAEKKVYKKWVKGCQQVCKCCEKGYYLDYNYKCQELPCNCEIANPDGTCKCCEQGYQLCEGVCIKKMIKGKKNY